MRLAASNTIPPFGKICALVGVCCLMNFGIWGYYDNKYGGNALNGSVENGRYFFRNHGKKTEVSADVWNFSQGYTKVTIVLFVVAGISLLIFGAYAMEGRQKNVQPGAAPNGGSATPFGNSGVKEGPPSMSRIVGRMTRGSKNTVMLFFTVFVVVVVFMIFSPSCQKVTGASHSAACKSNLQALENAKAKWATEHHKTTNDAPAWSDLLGTNRYLQMQLACPDGGVLRIGRVGELPTCSFSGHNL